MDLKKFEIFIEHEVFPANYGRTEQTANSHREALEITILVYALGRIEQGYNEKYVFPKIIVTDKETFKEVYFKGFLDFSKSTELPDGKVFLIDFNEISVDESSAPTL